MRIVTIDNHLEIQIKKGNAYPSLPTVSCPEVVAVLREIFKVKLPPEGNRHHWEN